MYVLHDKHILNNYNNVIIMQAGGFCGKKTGLSANPKAFINSSNYLALMNLETSKCQISVMSANGVFTEC